ncbi:hypothetical protein [Chryseobacterium oryctis]|uniref:Uncharacterized protein n=1 Tax=Chryseobacterium oryctis TaxID=2952618 RepID=A0ABT3HRZ8_9FLAO|nr:hypothetical protein [Chryseobacterium oryctis]MCW3162460.1 hypothetical protein [Chryseobacterium oryctis]
MQKYKKYHSDIKVCYALGIQNEILPEKFVKEIPGSTSFYWKDIGAKKFVGSEFASVVPLVTFSNRFELYINTLH